MKLVNSRSFALVLSVMAMPIHAQDLDPAEVIAEYAEIIQTVISPDLPADRFISILPIGLSVDRDEAYYPLANSCLRPVTFPGDLASSIRVSDVYRHAIQNMARIKLSSQPTEEDVNAAEEFYAANYEKYNDYATQFRRLRASITPDLSINERNAVRAELTALEDQWVALGRKFDVEDAINTMLLAPRGFLTHRIRALDDAGGRLGASPSVELSSYMENWGVRGGWVTLKYDDSYTSNVETTEIKKRRGSGGFNAGFFRIGGSGSRTTIEESIVTDVEKLAIEVDLKLVQIERPWFDHSVFFEPMTWGWRAIEGENGSPPLISSGLTDGSFVEQMNEQIYNGRRIDCQLYPAAFILAKRRKLTATVSNDTYERILRESSGGGSASFFGFSLGGGGSNKFEKITDTDDSTTFSITSSDWSADPSVPPEDGDIVILGTISRVVPLGPTPEAERDFTDEVWR